MGFDVEMVTSPTAIAIRISQATTLCDSFVGLSEPAIETSAPSWVCRSRPSIRASSGMPWNESTCWVISR